jgi:hypothetical protein
MQKKKNFKNNIFIYFKTKIIFKNHSKIEGTLKLALNYFWAIKIQKTNNFKDYPLKFRVGTKFPIKPS